MKVNLSNSLLASNMERRKKMSEKENKENINLPLNMFSFSPVFYRIFFYLFRKFDFYIKSKKEKEKHTFSYFIRSITFGLS